MKALSHKHLKNFVRLFSLSFLFIIFFIACKKTDFVSHQSKLSTAEDFFKTKSQPSKKVASVIQSLRMENAKTGFVDKLPAHAGSPIWEKLAIKQGYDYSRMGQGDSTEIFIIPLTENEQNLSSVIVAQELDSGFLINCYTASYLNGIAAGVNGNNIDAVQNTLLLFFMMESKCFGTSEFHHIPRMTFPQSHLLGSDSNKIITIVPDSTGDSLVKCVVFKHCIKTTPCTEGSCDWCPLCISTYCYGSPPPPAPDPTPDPVPGPGSGGGGTPCTNCPPAPLPPDCFNPFYLIDPCAPIPVPPTPVPPAEPPVIYDSIVPDPTFIGSVMECTYDSLVAKSQHFRDLNNTFDGVAGNSLLLHRQTLPLANSYSITRGFAPYRYIITNDPSVDTTSSLFRKLNLSHEFIHARFYYSLELAGLMIYDNFGEPSLDTSNGVLGISLVNFTGMEEAERLRLLIRQYNISCSWQPGQFSNWVHFLFGAATFNNETYRQKIQNMLLESEDWSSQPAGFVTSMKNRFAGNWRTKICEYLSWFGLSKTTGFAQFLQAEGITEDIFQAVIDQIKLNASKNCQ
jgi:hypothetical protein